MQAEDGIRGGHVTGVQTCALPIWNEIKNLLGLTDLSTEQVANLSIQDFAEMAATDLLKGERLTSEMERIKERSEERRVGKGVNLGSGQTMSRTRTVSRM